MKDLALKDEVFAVLGAAIDVHRHLGAGFLESVYAEALARELEARDIPFEREVSLEIMYRGKPLSKRFQADLVARDVLIVELKAVAKLGLLERAQVVNYLKATGLHVGLLINFGSHPKLEWERVVHQVPK
ncbi:MAG TPA: GxxExxY protein [Geothrix sp.]|nr:GxxExxY protein [Geothrix sp.]